MLFCEIPPPYFLGKNIKLRTLQYVQIQLVAALHSKPLLRCRESLYVENMKKPNWVCSNCSIWTSRKSNVKRHIQIVHRGYGDLVSFIDYMAGRKSGLYFPSRRPSYEKKSSSAINSDLVTHHFIVSLLWIFTYQIRDFNFVFIFVLYCIT